MLYLHGNGANLSTPENVERYEALRRLGLQIVAPEYPGFGEVNGTPSEAALDAAARDAWAWLREQGVPPSADRDLRLVAGVRRRDRPRERRRRACGRPRRRLLGRRRPGQRVVSVAAGPPDGAQPLRVARTDRAPGKSPAPAARDRRHHRAGVACPDAAGRCAGASASRRTHGRTHPREPARRERGTRRRCRRSSPACSRRRTVSVQP